MYSLGAEQVLLPCVIDGVTLIATDKVNGGEGRNEKGPTKPHLRDATAWWLVCKADRRLAAERQGSAWHSRSAAEASVPLWLGSSRLLPLTRCALHLLFF